MENLFSNLKYPFLYLDRSYIFRSNVPELQVLTRKLLLHHPDKFKKIIEEIRDLAECETSYYQQISALQQAGIISTLITFEVFHKCIIPASSNVIPLFGQYSTQSSPPPKITLWGENIRSNRYLRASTALLDAHCIVADVDFFELTIGKELQRYITKDKTLFIIGSSPTKSEGTHAMYQVPPYKFIDALYSAL